VGPPSYEVFHKSLRSQKPEDQEQDEIIFADFESHKYLPVNLVKEYVKRRHLPAPPLEAPPQVQEAFMSLNILKDDPELFIEGVLEPLKTRFSEDFTRSLTRGKRNYQYCSFSFGTVQSINGPALVDELIQQIR